MHTMVSNKEFFLDLSPEFAPPISNHFNQTCRLSWSGRAYLQCCGCTPWGSYDIRYVSTDAVRSGERVILFKTLILFISST